MMSGVAYAWSLMGVLTIIRSYLPPEFTNFMKHWIKKLVKKFWSPDPYCRFHFHELDSRRRTNHLYRQVEMHLRAKHLIKDADDLYLSLQDESAKKISYTLAGTSSLAGSLLPITNSLSTKRFSIVVGVGWKQGMRRCRSATRG